MREKIKPVNAKMIRTCCGVNAPKVDQDLYFFAMTQAL